MPIYRLENDERRIQQKFSLKIKTDKVEELSEAPLEYFHDSENPNTNESEKSEFQKLSLSNFVRRQPLGDEILRGLFELEPNNGVVNEISEFSKRFWKLYDLQFDFVATGGAVYSEFLNSNKIPVDVFWTLIDERHFSTDITFFKNIKKTEVSTKLRKGFAANLPDLKKSEPINHEQNPRQRKQNTWKPNIRNSFKLNVFEKDKIRKKWETIKLELGKISFLKISLSTIYKSQLCQKSTNNKKELQNVDLLLNFLQITSIQHLVTKVKTENAKKIEIMLSKVEKRMEQVSVCRTRNLIPNFPIQQIKLPVFSLNNLTSEFKIEKKFLIEYHMKKTLAEKEELNKSHLSKEFHFRIDSCQVCNYDQSFSDNVLVFCSVF